MLLFARRDDFMPQLGLARTCWFATALIQKLNAEALTAVSLRAAHCITVPPYSLHAATISCRSKAES
jgi:hypothetical protein